MIKDDKMDEKERKTQHKLNEVIDELLNQKWHNEYHKALIHNEGLKPLIFSFLLAIVSIGFTIKSLYLNNQMQYLIGIILSFGYTLCLLDILIIRVNYAKMKATFKVNKLRKSLKN